MGGGGGLVDGKIDINISLWTRHMRQERIEQCGFKVIKKKKKPYVFSVVL